MNREIVDRIVYQYEELGKSIKELDSAIPALSVNETRVKPDQNLQAALDSMKADGGVMTLSAGDYNIAPTLRFKNKLIVIRGDGPVTIRGFVAQNRSGNVSFENLNFNKPMTTAHILMGADQKSLKVKEEVPSGFTYRGCVFDGPCRRAMYANCKDLLVEDNVFSNYYEANTDSQVIAGTNGSENHIIRRNKMEAASENIIYGGSDAASEEMCPKNIRILDNELTKRAEWKTEKYNMKCLLELKNAQDVVIRGNKFDGAYKQAWGNAPAMVIKSANQGGTNPYARSEDVLIENNIIQNVGTYISLLSEDEPGNLPGRTKNIMVRMNLFHAMNGEPDGRAIKLGEDCIDVTFDHNTFLDNRHSFLEWWGELGNRAVNFRYINNISEHGTYGVHPNLPDLGGEFACNAIYKKLNQSGLIKLPESNVYYVIGNPVLESHKTSDGKPVGAYELVA